MEIKKLLKECGIIGICANYKTSLSGMLVKDLKIKNINAALKMVGLDNSFADKKIEELTLSETLKIDLATKLNKDIIVIGGLSKSLIYKDIEYIKKLLIKLNNDYNKKIVVIDEDVSIFINLVKQIYVIKDKKIVYNTSDFYDYKLYEFVKMPKIIEFIKYVNKDKKILNENVEIYELIKDIFRGVS